jgi:hypothetical protein
MSRTLAIFDSIFGACGDDRTMTSPGLAYWWAAADGRTEVDPAAVACMIAQPGFPDACRLVLKYALERTGRNVLMTRVTKDISRLVYGYIVLYLDARGGITLTAIQDLCQEVGIAGRGRARMLLFHLRAIDYIRPTPKGSDRRVQHYLPSPDMQASLRDAVSDELRAFSPVEPAAAHAADRLVEPEFFKAYMLRLGQAVTRALKIRPVRLLSHFSERNAGLIILWDILASAEEGDVYPPRGRLQMSVSGLADKYEVSRSHVFRLLRDAEQLGLLKRDPDEQTGVIAEELRQDLIGYHVDIFTGLAMCAHHALMSDHETMAHAALQSPARPSGEIPLVGPTGLEPVTRPL